MSLSSRRRHRRRGRGAGANTILIALLVGAVVAVGAILAGVGYVYSIASKAPPLNSLKARDPGAISRIYAADGTPLGFISANDLRQPATDSEIPQVLKDATVAIEDQRFYKHKGVDYEGIVRAAFKNAIEHEKAQGGSTITMQLVRNIYINDEKTYKRKIVEAKLAEELEQEHSKQWILDTYLNNVPYGTVGGQSAVGVKAAARVYFNKPLKNLTLPEAAMIAGLPQATDTYSPVRNPNAARTRRNEVLRKMADLGMISQAQASQAIASPLGLHVSKYYFKRDEKYFFDYVQDQLFQQYGAATVRQGGLKVYTTIDLEKQREARAAIRENLAGVGPASAIVTIDPKTGYIEAMASSQNYAQSNFNLAVQGHRQPGSTFKVMVLMTALREGVNPDTTHYVSKSPTHIDDPPYAPFDIKTYGGTGAGYLSIRQATLKSDNSVYIQLAMDLGPDKVKQTARDLGITSKLNGYPAEALGGLEDGVSPLEMARAYATIASGGWRSRPTAIRKIVFPGGRTEEGKTLPAAFRVKRVKAFDTPATALATQILEQNIQGGTGTHATIGCPAGGKTGTTDNNTDAWFVGFTPRMSTAVWVGFPNERVYMNGLYHGANVDGGTFPADIWGDYMRQAKGSFCGSFKPATKPFVSVPFHGHYSEQAAAENAKDQAAKDKADDNGGKPDKPDKTGGKTDGKTGGDNAGGDTTGGKGFDPTKYDAPPTSDQGGAVAPGDTG
jgi:penicillin-binding protein 1A